MTLDERLEYIATLQQTHDEQIGRLVEKTDLLVEKTDILVEQSTLNEKRLGILTERTIQAMDAITRLARIDALENPPQ